MLETKITVEIEKVTIKIEEDVVTAHKIEAVSDKGIDYDKLIEKFGCYKITDEMKEKIE